MTDEAKEPLVVDPHHIQDTLCIGQFNVHIWGPLATLTFTHASPKAGPMFEKSSIEMESVVRARIVTSTDNLLALRDLLVRITKTSSAQPMAASGGTRH